MKESILMIIATVVMTVMLIIGGSFIFVGIAHTVYSTTAGEVLMDLTLGFVGLVITLLGVQFYKKMLEEL